MHFLATENPAHSKPPRTWLEFGCDFMVVLTVVLLFGVLVHMMRLACSWAARSDGRTALDDKVLLL